MRLLKRLQFALSYDFNPEFIVIPFGTEFLPTRFLNYEDAEKFAYEQVAFHPMFNKPSVLVIVSKK